jgi:hypothetical protein
LEDDGPSSLAGRLFTELYGHNPPVDIRQFEFIEYSLDHDIEFFAKLDNAIRNVFVGRYEGLYDQARELLRTMNDDEGTSYTYTSRETFHARVMRGEQTEGIPPAAREDLFAGFLMPKILEETTNAQVMYHLTEWLRKKYSTKEPD